MTLNQVITQLKTIVESHRQIDSFYFGEPSDWVTLSLVYPGVLITLNAVRIVQNGMEMDFSIYVCDLVFQTSEDVNDKSLYANTIEVQSDSVSVINDLVALIADPDLDWILRNDTVNCEVHSVFPINEDMVAGAKADITIYISTLKDRCSAPVNNRNFILTEGGLEIFAEDGQGLVPEL